MENDVAKLPKPIKCRDKHFIPPRSAPEFMEEYEDMELRDDDIFIVTYPKSGTHWMQEIVHLILVDGHLEKLSAKDRRCVVELTEERIPHLKADAGPVLRQFKDEPSPRVITTHGPCLMLPKQQQEKCCKVIYVYRHPKEVVVSLYNFKRRVAEMQSGKPLPHSPALFSSFFDDVVSGSYDYGSWFDHVNHFYWHKEDDNYFFVSYEAMKEDLSKVVKDLALFLGRPSLEDDVVRRVVQNASLEVMRNSFKKTRTESIKQGKDVIDLNVYFNTGEANKWKNVFTKGQNDLFDKLFMEKMKDCELTKSYAPAAEAQPDI